MAKRAQPRRYSVGRLRLVVALLTLVTLPIVVGSFVLIYYYTRFGAMVDARLQGDRGRFPTRLYARPLELREGLPISRDELVRILNTLRYEQRSELPVDAGSFIVGKDTLTFRPRPYAGATQETLAVSFDANGIRDMRGLDSSTPYQFQTLEPGLITYLFDEKSREKRLFVRYADLPKHLVEALLAIEDRRFFTHPGLDPARILGAAIRNVQAESYIQGGSTLTQQLVKNFFLTPERTMKRKVQEALLAVALENRASKEDIFELYVNEIYLGQVGSFSINGVGEAARMYFNKDVGNLTLVESALIAGLIQSPNPYNPYRHPEKATNRRNVVLQAMADAGFIDAATAEGAAAQPLRVQQPSLDSAEAPYYVDFVKNELAGRYRPEDLLGGNLSVHTSLDLHLQDVAQQALEAGLREIEKTFKRPKPGPVQGALIAIEPRTGSIVALVGGRSYAQSQYNRVVWARRQPGSTFKPFVYLAAFEATFDDPALPPITPATIVDDTPTVFFYEDKEYIPRNYEDEYLGRITLRRALAKSKNVATVKVAEMVGFDRVRSLWIDKLGLADNIEPYPALALGSFETTPLELATAYNVLANGGLKVDPVTILRIEDGGGRTVEQHQPKVPERVVREESAFLVTYMLRSVFDEGTAVSARYRGFKAEAAGKTGTTNEMRDAWFAGYTPDLLCVVWVGFDDNTAINLPGSRAALPIWTEFMTKAGAGIESQPFSVPAENIIFLEIDKDTGLLATPWCPNRISEAFVAGTEPLEPCLYH